MAYKHWRNEAKEIVLKYCTMVSVVQRRPTRHFGCFLVCTILLMVFETGSCKPLHPVVRWSRVSKGSHVSLIGIPADDYEKAFKITWYKGRVYIQPSKSKYLLIKKRTELLIPNFNEEDVGSYRFLYSRNATQREIIFHLELLDEYDFFARHPAAVGTVIGMSFMLILLVVLLYYCCRRDTDIVFPQAPMKKSLAIHKQNVNNMSYKYGGVKFTTQVSMSQHTGRNKNTKEVRRDSLSALGNQSRFNRSKIVYKKTRKKSRRVSVQIMKRGESTML